MAPLLAFVALGGTAASATVWTSGEKRCHLEGPAIRLTFDDGGRPDEVQSILDVLLDEGVRAGFFPTGDWARANPGLLARMHDDGHWVGNHTGAHTNLARASDHGIRQAIAGGVAGALLRPPEGAFDERVRRIASELGYGLCLWTVDPQDWRGVSAAEVVRRVCHEIEPGGVAVLHLHADATIAGLRELVACIRNRGLELDALRRHVAAAADPATAGAVWVTASGSVRTAGFAHLGEPPRLEPPRAAVDVEVTPSGRGYWVAGRDGGVFAFGDAAFHGSAAGLALTEPVVALTRTPSGSGYWLLAADGGVFTFGDATFAGSPVGHRPTAPVVSMAPTPTGLGYWIVAEDGGVFTFGDARFFGSAVDLHLAAAVVDISATEAGDGYWLLGADGGVFSYGSAPFWGSNASPGAHALSIDTSLNQHRHVVVRDDGSVHQIT